MLDWIIANLTLHSPMLWLLLSIIASIITSVLTWRHRPHWIAWVWIGQWLLIPYVGLILGGLSPRLMGLSDIDWQATLGTGLGLVFAIVALLAVVRIFGASPAKPVEDSSIEERTLETTPSTRDSKLQRTATLLLVSGAEQFHWIFLRGALWETLTLAPFPVETPSYWAIWIAGAIVLFENALYRLSPRQWLVQVVALTATSIVFLYTRNFWLCWLLHATITLMLTPPKDSTLRFVPQAR